MSPGTTTNEDALYRRACALVAQKASVAYLQRSLGGIGYQRTTALLERMVAEGLIADYAGRRECDAAMKQAPSGTAPIRDRLRHALLDGGVVLDQKRLVLIFDPRQPGDNILQQVLNRLESAIGAPTHWVVRKTKDEIFSNEGEARNYAEQIGAEVIPLVPLQVQRNPTAPLTLPMLRSPDCWCESCDLKKNYGFRSRMSLCPNCGDKRCPRAENHTAPCRSATNPQEHTKTAGGAGR